VAFLGQGLVSESTDEVEAVEGCALGERQPRHGSFETVSAGVAAGV